MMTWNEHVEAHRAAMEFMGLRPPPSLLAFSFLEAPAPKLRRCKSPPPQAPRPTGHVYHFRSIGRRPMPNSERLEMLRNIRILRSQGVSLGPPATYGECPPPGTPCGHVSCRHHLGLNVDQDDGTITLTHPVPDTDPSRAHLMEKLSPRDKGIKVMIDLGDSNAEIATALGMRERTVMKIRKRMRAKLNVDPELDILAMRATCSLRVGDEGPHSLDAVVALMGGLHKVNVHRIEAAALAKMRGAMRDDGRGDGG
jgi:DNA-binding CsgD family transcriptional regulator